MQPRAGSKLVSSMITGAAVLAAGLLCLAAVEAGAATSAPSAKPHLNSPFPGCGIVRKWDGYRFQTRDPALKALRARMLAKRSMPRGSLRTLADRGDRLAAYKLAKMSESAGGTSSESDAIHYYSIAAYLGQSSAVPPLVGLLRIKSATMSKRRLAQAEQALEAAARRGNTDAMFALGTFYQDGVPLAKQPEAGFLFLCRAAVNGNVEAAFMIGNQLLQDGGSTPAETEFGLMLLRASSDSGDLVAAAILQGRETEQ